MTNTNAATEAIVDRLVDHGVDTVFTLASEEIIPLLSEIEEGGDDALDVVHCRHEQGAAAMADGYARAGDDVGVCLVGRGPAIAQTGTALKTASNRGSRVLYVVPESRLDAAHDGKGFAQTAFLDALVGSVECLRSPERVLQGLDDAFRRLREGDGPIAVQIPIDVLESDVPASTAPPEPTRLGRGARLHPDDAAVSRAIEAYRAADVTGPPVILAGRGAVRADAREAIERLADRLNAYLATSLPAIGYFADHPHYLGSAGGLGTAAANERLRESDFVLGFGASLNHHTLDADGAVGPDTTVVHVDTEPTSIGRYTDVDVGVAGDAQTTAEALCSELERLDIGPIGDARTTAPRDGDETSATPADRTFEDRPGTVDPRDLLPALDGTLPAERLVVADVGQYIGWVFDGLTFGRDDRLLWAVDFLALGQGLPVGIGAALAERERTPVVFCGDGGLMMILQELETAVRNDVPVVVVVIDDAALGAEYHMGRIRGHSEAVGKIPSPDFTAVASSLGAESHTVSSVGDVEALEPRLHGDLTGPLVLDCRVNPTVVHRAMGEIEID